MPSAKDYEAKPLPFTKPLTGISEKALQIHHGKLYAGYVAKMKEVASRLEAASKDQAVLDGANASYSELRALRSAETFATNGTYLHEAYFASLGGDGKAVGLLADAIAAKWGSVGAFAAFFSATAMAVRGWVVLAWDTRLGRLKIYGTDAHDQGGVWGCVPLVVLDVYEHAYFMDYGADRKSYVADFWKNLDWAAADAAFKKVNGITL